MVSKRGILVYRGCNTCRSLISKGMCKKELCLEITTPVGKEVARRANISRVPACVEIDTKNGKVRKCSIDQYLRKYLG